MRTDQRPRSLCVYLLLNMCVLEDQRGTRDVFLLHALSAAQVNGMLYPFINLFAAGVPVPRIGQLHHCDWRQDLERSELIIRTFNTLTRIVITDVIKRCLHSSYYWRCRINRLCWRYEWSCVFWKVPPLQCFLLPWGRWGKCRCCACAKTRCARNRGPPRFRSSPPGSPAWRERCGYG